jgi:N6-L-threonylcarbamoyladenine synthase
MPTNQSHARSLLKKGEANVIKRLPFTIQLTKSTGETLQEVKLGIDTGYQFLGASAISDKKELFSAEVELRINIVKLLSEKRMYRKYKRSRHHWYRKQRYSNRIKKYRKVIEGWLPPSIQHKLDSHIRFIDMISKKLLPISKIILETAKFDIRKIIDPEIRGEEYLEGPQKGFWNVREYVLDRDNHSCQYCKKNNVVLGIHHIESRKTGGNRPDNLITLCKKCHKDFHDGKIKLKIEKKRGHKAETCMNIIRKRLIGKLREKYNVKETFGYITKSKRIELELEKTHFNDAFVIAEGNTQIRCKIFNIKQKRRNNRCLQCNRKGHKPAIKKHRYKIQPMDLLWVKGKKYIAKSTHYWGKRVQCIDKLKNKFDFLTRLVDKVFNVGGFVWNT